MYENFIFQVIYVTYGRIGISMTMGNNNDKKEYRELNSGDTILIPYGNYFEKWVEISLWFRLPLHDLQFSSK